MIAPDYAAACLAAPAAETDPEIDDCLGWNRRGIEAALAEHGEASIRRRRLPAQQVVWLVIALALYRHRSVADVVAELDLALT